MSILLAVSYLGDWLDVLFRWFHVIVGVTWLGTSIYFVRLDNSLHPVAGDDSQSGSMTVGEHWGAHGGGFYHVTKYRRPPEPLPEPLHFATPWPAYSTWLTGFALLIVVYYANARTYLIDPSVADIAPGAAIALSAGLLVVGWFLYDLTCRLLWRWEWLVALAVVAMTAGAALLATSLFSPRAAFLQVGAMLGTFMAANVLTVIVPMHRKMVAARRAGAVPNPVDGARAKQRSVHNTYLTLPVLLAMLSNHASFIYGHSNGWLALLALMAIGALVRHGFIVYRQGTVPKLVPVVATLAVIGLVAWLAPAGTGGDSAAPAAAAAADGAGGGQPAAGTTDATNVASGAKIFQSAGCSGCHTLEAAGATGKAGPDLGRLRPPSSLVAEVVANGRGAMPPFKGRLDDDEIRAVAAYVASAAGAP
ncbi:MAG: urate hydroxylase PuuD [Solirubrobacteraceae bacterium]|nr:urate hydroxylase PuuD [Solirubrobacteraceae bacterium]